MNAYPALIVAGIVFAIIALAHLLRLFYRAEIFIAGKKIPMMASIIGFFIALVLSIWMFTVSCG